MNSPEDETSAELTAYKLLDLKCRFRTISRKHYPNLADYSLEEVYRGAMGPGGLYLASDMAERMNLQAGDRVLDLGCGRAQTSIFLAREYGLQVTAAGLWISPSENWQYIQDAGLQSQVMPIRVDARSLPFADEFFDAVFCMDSYFYYGTDSFFLRHLSKFLRPGGVICIGGPCFSREIDLEPNSVFEFPDAIGYHTPPWWRRHFERSHVVDVEHCELHPLGVELWEDYLRFNIDYRNTDDERPLWYEDIKILSSNEDGFLSHFILTAIRKPKATYDIDPL